MSQSSVHALNNKNLIPILIFVDKHDMVVAHGTFNKTNLKFASNIILVETTHGGHLGCFE